MRVLVKIDTNNESRSRRRRTLAPPISAGRDSNVLGIGCVGFARPVPAVVQLHFRWALVERESYCVRGSVRDERIALHFVFEIVSELP